MKTTLIASFVLNLSFQTAGQQIFVYDQQSSVDGVYREGGAEIQPSQPMGQSFTPTLDSVGFVRLHVYDATFGNNLNGTLYLNLRSDSITGPILASTDPVVLPPRAARPVDFLFSTPVPVTPGTTYFFQPVVQTGNTWGLNASDYNYAGGTAFVLGQPNIRNWDLWFREGIVVPEPSSIVLISLGTVGLLLALRRRFMKPTFCRIGVGTR